MRVRGERGGGGQGRLPPHKWGGLAENADHSAPSTPLYWGRHGEVKYHVTCQQLPGGSGYFPVLCPVGRYDGRVGLVSGGRPIHGALDP